MRARLGTAARFCEVVGVFGRGPWAAESITPPRAPRLVLASQQPASMVCFVLTGPDVRLLSPLRSIFARKRVGFFKSWPIVFSIALICTISRERRYKSRTQKNDHRGKKTTTGVKTTI